MCQALCVSFETSKWLSPSSYTDKKNLSSDRPKITWPTGDEGKDSNLGLSGYNIDDLPFCLFLSYLRN